MGQSRERAKRGGQHQQLRDERAHEVDRRDGSGGQSHACAKHRAQGDHRVEAQPSTPAEISQCHSVAQALFIGLRNDESAQQEKQIDGQIAVDRHLVAQQNPAMGHDDSDCRNAAKAVEYVEVSFHWRPSIMQRVLPGFISRLSLWIVTEKFV
jgi:hypothetical protein